MITQEQPSNSQPPKNEFKMNISRVNSTKYLVDFDVIRDVLIIKKEESTNYWTCSDSLGKYIYSNINLHNCFDHVYETEKAKWKKIHGLPD